MNKFDAEFARAAAQQKAINESMNQAQKAYSARGDYAVGVAMPSTIPVDDGPLELNHFNCTVVNGGFIVHFEHNRYVPMRPTIVHNVDELCNLIRSAVKRE